MIFNLTRPLYLLASAVENDNNYMNRPVATITRSSDLGSESISIAVRAPFNALQSPSPTSPVTRYSLDDNQDDIAAPVEDNPGLQEAQKQLENGVPILYTEDDAEESEDDDFYSYKSDFDLHLRKYGHISYPANAQQPPVAHEQPLDARPALCKVDEAEHSDSEKFYSNLSKHGHISYPANAQETPEAHDQLLDGTPLDFPIDDSDEENTSALCTADESEEPATKDSDSEKFYSNLSKYGQISFPANAQETPAAHEQLLDGTPPYFPIDDSDEEDASALRTADESEEPATDYYSNNSEFDLYLRDYGHISYPANAQKPSVAHEQPLDSTPALCKADKTEESEREKFYSKLSKYGHMSFPENAQEQTLDGTPAIFPINEESDMEESYSNPRQFRQTSADGHQEPQQVPQMSRTKKLFHKCKQKIGNFRKAFR